MSVSAVSSTNSWSWVPNQQAPATSKTQAIADANAAAQDTQTANQVATEQQASTRGDSQSINKLA